MDIKNTTVSNDYVRDVNNIPLNVCNIFDDVSDNYWAMQTLLLDVIEDHAPIKSARVRAKEVPFMNKRMRRAIMDRNRLFRKYKSHRNNKNREKYRIQQNLVTSLRKEAIKDYFKTNCTGASRNPNFWKTVKPFLTNKGNTQGNSIMISKDDKILTDPQVVSNEMNDYYINIASEIGGQANVTQGDQESNRDFVQKCIMHYDSHTSIVNIKSKMTKKDFTFVHIDNKTVDKIISSLDCTKATGYDKIPAKLLKPAAKHLSDCVTSIYNQCIDTCSFPQNAKLADVVPLYKKGDNLIAKNYRPVSILPSVSKILEKVILHQLKPFLDTVLDPRVCAYRTGYSCQYALLRLVEDWKSAIEDKRHVASMLMDLSKAFDCLPHQLLIAKLNAYGLSIDGCTLIWSYLKDRLQRVRIDGFYSEWQKLLKGVPQGSVVGPVLFNAFVNDIFAALENSHLTNYADDNTISVITNSKTLTLQTLKSESEVAVAWFQENMMEANPSKFQALVLQNTGTPFTIGEITIKSEKHVTLLGVNLDNELNFSEHIKTLCRKAAAQLSVLQRLAKYLDLASRMAIFRCFILSHFSYCNLVWHFCGATNTNKLERIQHRALKFVYQDWTSSYEQLLSRADLPTLELSRTRAIIIEVYKALHHLSPPFMWDLFKVKKTPYNLRRKNQVSVKHCRTVRHGINCLSVYGAKLWNSLPNDWKSLDYENFKCKIHSWNFPICDCKTCNQ